MALYNEILVGRFNRFLQKIFSLKGKTGAPQLAGEIIPVLPFFNGVENRFVEGWNRYGQFLAVAANGAGNRSGIRLRNPAVSNCIVVLEKIQPMVPSAVASNWAISRGTATTDLAIAATMPNARFDGRQAVGGTSVLILSQQNVGTPLTSLNNAAVIWQVNTTGLFSVDAILFEEQEIPLAPGDAVQFDSSFDNTQINVNVWWRERFLEDSERS